MGWRIPVLFEVPGEHGDGEPTESDASVVREIRAGRG